MGRSQQNIHLRDFNDFDEHVMEVRHIPHGDPLPEGYEWANEPLNHHNRHSRMAIKEIKNART